MAEDRIQKLISASGLMSRRAAEKCIQDGKVFVNGYKASLGDKADLTFDEVIVDGKSIGKQQKKVYAMLNKPRGYVTTLSDEKDRKIITDLIYDIDARVYPIGRLDMNSEGLLLLTNDGDFANKVMHPSKEYNKTYLVYVGGEDIPSKIGLLEKPIKIDGRYTKPAIVEMVNDNGNNAVIKIIIKEGRNRQIRRLCEAAGLKVKSLKRVGEGPLSLGNLKTGAWRYLTDEEVKSFL